MLASRWLSGIDVEPYINVTINSVTEEAVGRDKEITTVVWFDEFDRGLICNKTNKRNIITICGKSPDVNKDWKGLQVQLYATMQEFSGEEYNVVRVRPVQPAGGKPKPANKTGKNTPSQLEAIKTLIAQHKDVDIKATLGRDSVRAYLDAGGTLAEALEKLQAKYEPRGKKLNVNFEEVDI